MNPCQSIDRDSRKTMSTVPYSYALHDKFSIYFNYSNLKDEIMMDDLQHEEILNNFDQFIKMAGSELLTLKDVARNITGWTDIDQI